MQIPQAFTVVLPILVTPLVGWLNNPRMPEWLRCLIAAVIIVAVSVLWAVYVHAFTSNLIEDFVLIASYCSVLGTTLLLPLYKMALIKLPSPFNAFFNQPQPAQQPEPEPIKLSTPPTVRGPQTPQ